MPVSSLDLTNNTNLEILYGENLIFLESLDAKNGNNGILNITLPCEFEGEPCQLTELDCVKVDDEVAANNNEPPYNGWYLAANFVYSEDCILGVSENGSSKFSIHPNPAKNELFITAQNTTENLKIKIFNIEGKLLSAQSITLQDQKAIDVSQLLSGIYFLNIEDENGNTTIKKFIKQ
ncbi:MAG: T9SS type A sorting domain-containing protein [Aequorivita sp.]|nr:T9SS type A sorting domain-containing protein [Aequorivita sp.]